MAVNHGDDILVSPQAHSEMLKAAECLASNEVRDKVMLLDDHAYLPGNRDVVSVLKKRNLPSYAIDQQVLDPICNRLVQFGIKLSVYLAQLGQAKHVQLMPQESMDDVLLQGGPFLFPIFTTNLVQLDAHVVETDCHLGRVVWQLSEGSLFNVIWKE